MVNKDKREEKSTVFSFRLPNNLLNEIDKMAKQEQIDRASWIKRAMVIAIGELRDSAVEGAIEDYIAGKIDDDLFIKETENKQVPQDIKEARKRHITHLEERLTNKRVKGK
ncbi:hypothetical protein HYW76_02700 [Candidatus Pacearchaeota archaeon]|nr:hypothetical protein [Candidatus Pacearchaeota archaeon]